MYEIYKKFLMHKYIILMVIICTALNPNPKGGGGVNLASHMNLLNKIYPLVESTLVGFQQLYYYLFSSTHAQRVQGYHII